MSESEPVLENPGRGDLVLVAFLALVGLCFSLNFPAGNGKNWQVQVVGHADRFRHLDGTVSGFLQIPGLIGTSTVECDGTGRWRFVQSACPNQICVRTGWFSAPVGVPCVPNGVILEPKPSTQDVDGVAR